MSLAILHCRAEYGTDAPPVTIEVFLSGGLPAFTIVGMAETAVRESKDRVRGALLVKGQKRLVITQPLYFTYRYSIKQCYHC